MKEVPGTGNEEDRREYKENEGLGGLGGGGEVEMKNAKRGR